jgi:isopropylmalate/homocitrate/citramalate synthase
MSVAFQRFLSTSARRREIYAKISPILTDVSLRDGIQYADPTYYSTPQKKDMFHTILFQENPPNMEVGSLVSSKILPIMSDSLEIYKYVNNQEWISNRELIIDLFGDGKVLPRDDPSSEKRYFILVPALSKLPEALKSGVKHFSFTTSVSDPFQKKNVKRSLKETKSAFSDMFIQYPFLSDLYTKLYVSCIRECPLSGQVNLDWVVKELLYYHTEYPFNEICLSDTCGTLNYDDFQYIVETVNHFGLPFSKISLHLHVDSESLTNTASILRYCFAHGIRKFDVSLIDLGGCPMTLSKEKSFPNLSYEQFYSIVKKYIEMVE